MMLVDQLWKNAWETHSICSIVSNEEASGFKKNLSLTQLTAYGLCATLGAGIFVVCGEAGVIAGPSMVISFLIAMGGAALNSLVFAEWGTALPSTGSSFSFVLASMGELFASITGSLLIVEYGIGAAAIAKGCGNYLLAALPQSVRSIFGDRPLFNGALVFSPVAGILTVIVLFAALRGVSFSTKLQAGMASLNACLILAFVCAGCIMFFDSNNLSPFMPGGASGMIGASATLFFSYIGFDAVTILGHSARKSSDVAKAMLLVLFICTVLYLSVAFTLTGMIPFTHINVETPLASAFASHGVVWAAKAVSVVAFLVTSMTLISSFVGLPRLLYKLSHFNGCLPFPHTLLSKISNVNPENGNPTFACLTSAVICVPMALILPFGALVDGIAVATLETYSLTSIGLIFMSIRDNDSNFLDLFKQKQNEIDASVVTASNQTRNPLVNASATTQSARIVTAEGGGGVGGVARNQSEQDSGDIDLSPRRIVLHPSAKSSVLSYDNGNKKITCRNEIQSPGILSPPPVTVTQNFPNNTLVSGSLVVHVDSSSNVSSSEETAIKFSRKIGRLSHFSKSVLFILIAVSYILPHFFLVVDSNFGNRWLLTLVAIYALSACWIFLALSPRGGNQLPLHLNRFSFPGFPFVPLACILVNGMMSSSIGLLPNLVVLGIVVFAGLNWMLMAVLKATRMKNNCGATSNMNCNFDRENSQVETTTNSAK